MDTGLTIISDNSLSKVNIKFKYNKPDKSSILLLPFRISIIMTLGNHEKFYVEIHFNKALKHILNFEHQWKQWNYLSA